MTYKTLLQLCKDYTDTVAGAGTTSPLLCGKAAQWNKAEDAVMGLGRETAVAVLQQHESTGAGGLSALMLYSLLDDYFNKEEPKA